MDKTGNGANRMDHQAKDVSLAKLETMGKFKHIQSEHIISFHFPFIIETFRSTRFTVGYELNGTMERPIHIAWVKKDNTI